MGRLQAVAIPIVTWLALSSCNEEAKKAATIGASRERSEVVEATGTQPSSPTTPTASSPPSPRLTGPRKLCEGQLAKPGHDSPKKPISRKNALGARALPPSLPSGKWTWVNLWAAWCAPCKEELPRLGRFATRLGQANKDIALAFVSLDDDERQLESFLTSQHDDGLKATYWLREGHERDEWLAGAGLGRDPGLPLQLLIDPHGKIRCTVNGAIEEQDYAEIAAIVSTP